MHGHPASSDRPLRRLAIATVVRVGIPLALLLAAEATMRQVWSGYAFYERTEPGQHADRTFGARSWPRKDAELGWVLGDRPTDFFADAGRKAPDYKPNPQGFRDAKDFAAVDLHSGRQRVMVLGDSFVFGVGLDARDAIPVALERLLPASEVYNVAIPGWGLDQMLLAYRKYADAIQPEVVVLGYIDEDLARSYEAFRPWEGMNKPSFDLRGDTLVLREAGQEADGLAALLRWVTGHSILANKLSRLRKDHEVRRLGAVLMRELVRETERRGQRVLFVRIPLLQDDPASREVAFWNMKDVLADAHAPLLDLGDEMPRDPALYRQDGHLGPLGTAYVAERIRRSPVFARGRLPRPGGGPSRSVSATPQRMRTVLRGRITASRACRNFGAAPISVQPGLRAGWVRRRRLVRRGAVPGETSGRRDARKRWTRGQRPGTAGRTQE